MKKYYPKINDYDICLEPCLLKNDGTHIGSVSCSECVFNKGTNIVYLDYHNPQTGGWLKCSKIKKATTGYSNVKILLKHLESFYNKIYFYIFVK